MSDEFQFQVHQSRPQLWSPPFLLSEASGRRSRGNGRIFGPAIIVEGSVLEAVDGAARPIVYAPLTSGVAAGIAVYPATVAAAGAYIDLAVIVRACEVDGRLLKGIAPERKAAAYADLAALDIIVR
jgi:Bacteriophage lambda head decoration protein D